jgi:hypothetical protein
VQSAKQAVGLESRGDVLAMAMAVLSHGFLDKGLTELSFTKSPAPAPRAPDVSLSVHGVLRAAPDSQ